ncbi:MAG: chain-length determining protein [Woeseiaceae bacterium]|nr:chain-length determining protein [Woeseiaceae bacterium]
MYNIVSKFLAEVIGALRYRWHGMLFAWLVCLLGWAGVTLIPNSYESKAVLYIDTATVLRPLLADLAVNTNVMSEVTMMTEVLLSRPQLERVVRETDLDLRAKSPEEMENLLEMVEQRIEVTGGSQRNPYAEQNLYTIKFTDKNPQMVHRVVQSLLDTFVEKSLGQNKEDSVGAQRFIEEQILEYEERLAEAEQRLADFKKQNVGMMPSEGQDYYVRLQVALEEREDVRSEYSRVVKRRDELQKQIDGEEPTFGLLARPDDPSKSETGGSSQVRLLEEELASLLLKYTEKHPKVVDLRNRISQMREQERRIAAPAGDRPTYSLDTDLVSMNSLDLNPVYQSLKISISEANAELSEITQKLADAEERVVYLRRMVDTIPEVEAQLARLNRDYEVNQTQHTALLKRLESARLSEEAEFRNEEIKFRVIEPPVEPLKPVGPNRYLFATVVLLAGLGIGGALSYLLNLVNPVFNAVDDLRHSLQLPVLGSISSYQNDEARIDTRKGNVRFGLATAGLVVAWVGVMAMYPAAEAIEEAFLAVGALL